MNWEGRMNWVGPFWTMPQGYSMLSSIITTTITTIITMFIIIVMAVGVRWEVCGIGLVTSSNCCGSKNLSRPSAYWYIREKQRGTASSNSRFQPAPFQRYSANLSVRGPQSSHWMSSQCATSANRVGSRKAWYLCWYEACVMRMRYIGQYVILRLWLLFVYYSA